MHDLWIALGICAVFIVGAVMPLLRERGQSKATPLPPRPAQAETLHDWRKEKRGP